MINIDIIEQEILNLESHDTTYATVERLAWLYIVRDKLKTPAMDEITGELSGSEFCRACSGVPMEPLMRLLSEHMECIKVLHPREYSVIIDRIVKLKE